MNEITLPASPNWYLSHIIACAGDGTVAWGARNCVVVAKKKDNDKGLDYTIFDKAHSERVASVAFSLRDDENSCYYLASAAENNLVNVWNMATLSIKTKLNMDATTKIAAIDWSKHDCHLIRFVTLDGLFGTININNNITQKFFINAGGKINATCIACCPHDNNLVAIGAKSGLVYIINARGLVKYKLRGHDTEIVSLSWCPVPHNIFDNSGGADFLLASGAKDRHIFFWKAGSSGRSQIRFTLPNTPLDTNKHRSKINFTTVYWLTPKILISNSSWGELLQWNLSGLSKKKFSPMLVHGQHSNGLFAIAGLADEILEELEDEEEEDWREKAVIKSIWTLAQDRQVVCCSLSEGKTSMDYVIPTQGGFVYCLAACPIDTSLVAFGVGDYMIRLWNLSEPHENAVEVNILWEKIKAKVRSLSWHPEKENILAFGTEEGRIGLFDTNTKKPPQVAKQYFKQTIYTLGWGPIPKGEEYGLYAVGEGELAYFNPKSLNTDPTTVVESSCAEFSWKPDYSMLAVGYNDGSITLFNRNLTKKFTIHTLYKAVQYLTWHPDSTMSDLNTSSMQNYLAVAVNDVPITVFEILNTNEPSEENSEDPQNFYKSIATLNGHTDKVVGLAWSPHISGYLVSCSYDYTAQVWKVDTQEIIATYISHQSPIQCCMWSPLSHDFIITGSADFTLRIWKVSNQKAIPAGEPKSKSTKSKRTKRKKTKILAKTESVESNDIESVDVQSTVTNGGTSKVNEETQELTAEKSEEVVKENKKKSKKQTVFPGYAEITHNNKLWCAYIQNLLELTRNNAKSNEMTAEKNDNVSNGVVEDDSVFEEAEDLMLKVEIPPLLGSKKNLEDALNHERKILHTRKHYDCTLQIDLWTGGNLKDSLLEIMKKNELTDYSVSLAASISKEFWEKICEGYALQLVSEENPEKAASYMLCLNKVHEAIDVLLTTKSYRRAYVIAASRLDMTDPVIEKILTQWASNAHKVGNYQTAVECYIKLEKYDTAAKLLERRKDLDSLVLAADVAKFTTELRTTLAEKAIMQALLDSDIATARSIIRKHPQIEYCDIEVTVFDELDKILKNVDDNFISKWVVGLSNISLLETLNSKFEKCPKKYSLLLQKDIIPFPVSKKMILLNVSHQFALSALSDDKKQKLQHIVRALAFLTQHDSTNSDLEDKYLSSISYFCALDNKSIVDSTSIFHGDDNDINTSLRAYLCHALIKWFNKTELSQKQKDEVMIIIVDALKKYIQDLFNKESIKFWTTANEIRKLETELTAEMSKTKSNEAEEVDKTEILIERLDQLRNAKNYFLSNRVSSPNPMFSYGIVNEFISTITNEEIREEISKLVTDTWTKVLL